MEWGWRAIHFPGQLWHSLTDAKQPFLMWLFGVGQTLFADPLIGSRLISVLAGVLSLTAIWKIAIKYFNLKVAVLACLVYCFVPTFLFFDRQALMESGLTAASLWSLYFFLSLRDRPNLKTAVFLGCVLGLGFFIKNSAALFLLGFLAIQIISSFKKGFPVVKQATLTFYVLITFLLINLPLFFQPLYWSTLNTNSRWTFTFTELLGFPFQQWFTNLLGNLELIFVHFTPALFILCLIGLVSLFKSQKPGYRTLLLWFLLPLVPYLLTQKFMNFMIWRYQTPLLAVAPLIIGYALSKFKPLIIGVFLFLPFVFSLILVADPIAFFNLQSKLTRYSYIEGYVTGSDTGYEVNAIVSYLKNLSKSQPIFVGLAVHTFNPESGIWAYFRKDPAVTVTYFDSGLMDPEIMRQVACLAAVRPVYFVAKLNDTAGLDKYLELVTVITNSQNSDYATIYTLKKDCTGPTVVLDLETPITH